MKDIRRNEFIDLMEMNEFIYEEKEFFVRASIPVIGDITYYPKKDKINIHKSNKWFDSGFYYIKKYIKNLPK